MSFDDLTLETMREHGFAQQPVRTGVWARQQEVDFVGRLRMEIRLATPFEQDDYLATRSPSSKACSQVFTFTIVNGEHKASRRVDQGELMDAMAHFATL